MFVYTREAHPGETQHAHGTFDDKLAAARRIVDRWGISRRMLVDDLEGPVHRAYGLLPNMSFVISKGGFVIYKANWTDPDHLDLVVRRTVEELQPTPEGRRRVPFTVEWVPRRLRDDDGFMEGLLESGPQAVEEYISAVTAVNGAGAARRLQSWWDAKRSAT
ncbi:MAG: hypothetical protein KTR31_28035 [Myxococcales bacterium]|nr:hypothetical protein [Myxococcales bacterium]